MTLTLKLPTPSKISQHIKSSFSSSSERLTVNQAKKEKGHANATSSEVEHCISVG